MNFDWNGVSKFLSDNSEDFKSDVATETKKVWYITGTNVTDFEHQQTIKEYI